MYLEYESIIDLFSLSFHLLCERRRESSVSLWRQLLHRLLFLGWQTFQTLDELNVFSPADLGLAPREILELLVRVWNVKLAHHSLHGLSQQLIVLFKLTVQLFGIDCDASKAFLEGSHSLQVIAESDAKIPQHCAVGQVALIPRYWQFMSEMCE